MTKFKSMLRTAGAASVGLLALSSVASAEDKFAWSMTIGGTSDYIFRGISQTFADPAFQMSVDATYGMFYVGAWGSNVDFGEGQFGPAQIYGPEANAEIDLYAGVRPTWGPATFDLGVIYYWYPGSDDWANFNNLCFGPNPGPGNPCPNKIDYFELKAGYSLASPWIKNLTTGTTVFWSPDYTLETDSVVTVESTASYLLPAIGMFTPTISGTYGSVYGDIADGFSVGGGAEDEYSYWNAGLSLVVEKFTLDFRYHDTDIDVVSQFGSCVKQSLCDERFVFTLKTTLP